MTVFVIKTITLSVVAVLLWRENNIAESFLFWFQNREKSIHRVIKHPAETGTACDKRVKGSTRRAEVVGAAREAITRSQRKCVQC
jgi:hypothetical protein